MQICNLNRPSEVSHVCNIPHATSLVDPLQPILRRLDLLRQYQVGVPALDLGEEEREECAGDTAAEEDYNDVDDGGQYCSWFWRGRRAEEDSLQRIAGVPISLLRVLNAKAEMMAPHFPAAADMPCAKARKRVGKSSAG